MGDDSRLELLSLSSPQFNHSITSKSNIMRSFIAAIAVLALGAFARDDRIVINHSDIGSDWCTAIDWAAACNTYTPATGIVLSALCENGDYDGSNPQTTTRVVCSVGTGAPNQLTLITQFVANKLGATPAVGLPQDV